MILASAAIPNVFPAVHTDGGTFWDGLFSQNPPVHELLDAAPDELWVIQINPTARAEEPRTVLDIADRRNELSGNLSLYQELHGIEVIDRLLAEGVLVGSRYKHITVRVLEFARPPSTRLLGLDVQAQPRRPVPAGADEQGERQAEEFLATLGFESAWRAKDIEAVLGHLAPDVQLTAAGPFAGVDGDARTRIAELCRTAAMDLTRKQLTRDRAVWDVRLPEGRGRIEAEIVDGKVTRLRLQLNASTEAVKPCRWLRPPTGTDLARREEPRHGRAQGGLHRADVVVGVREHRGAAPVAGEQQRAARRVGRAVEQLGEVLARARRVAHLEPHGLPDLDDLADGHRPALLVGPDDAADEEVAAAVLVGVLVDRDAEVQPARRHLLLGGRQRRDDLDQPRVGGLARQLQQQVALRPRDDHRGPDGAAALADHRARPDGLGLATEHHADAAPFEHVAVAEEAVGARPRPRPRPGRRPAGSRVRRSCRARGTRRWGTCRGRRAWPRRGRRTRAAAARRCAGCRRRG